MNKFDSIEVIRKIKSLTENKTLIWSYLDENSCLYNGINYYPKTDDILDNIKNDVNNINKEFDSENSFYANIGDNYLVLLTTEEPYNLFADRLLLLLVPRTFKGIEKIKYSSFLLELHMFIKTLLPNSNDIIEDILKM